MEIEAAKCKLMLLFITNYNISEVVLWLDITLLEIPYLFKILKCTEEVQWHKTSKNACCVILIYEANIVLLVHRKLQRLLHFKYCYIWYTLNYKQNYSIYLGCKIHFVSVTFLYSYKLSIRRIKLHIGPTTMITLLVFYNPR